MTFTVAIADSRGVNGMTSRSGTHKVAEQVPSAPGDSAAPGDVPRYEQRYEPLRLAAYQLEILLRPCPVIWQSNRAHVASVEWALLSRAIMLRSRMAGGAAISVFSYLTYNSTRKSAN